MINVAYEVSREQLEYVEKRLSGLRKRSSESACTKTADEIWKSRIGFYIDFFEKLENQLKRSKSVICE